MLDSCNFEFILTHVAFSQPRKVSLFGSLNYIEDLPEFESGAEDILTGIPPEFLHDLIPKVIDGLTVEYDENEFGVELRHSQLLLRIHQDLDYDNIQDTRGETFSFVRRSLNVIANTQPLTSTSVLSICGCVFDGDKDLFSEELWDSWFSRLDRMERFELQWIQIKDSCMALLK
jgi:hypothetical protein